MRSFANFCFLLVCSAQDKAILEDAYNNNAKPDKQARLDIVSRVSLNEKEVQVSRSITRNPSIAITYNTRLVYCCFFASYKLDLLCLIYWMLIHGVLDLVSKSPTK